MEDILCEPVELTESELDEVAGGDPFGNFALAAGTQSVTNIGFNIGKVVGHHHQGHIHVNSGLNLGTIFE